MFFEMDTYVFKTNFEKAMKVVSKKNYNPVLENVTLEIKNNNCFLYATNFVDFVRIDIGRVYSEDCSFVLGNSKELLKALKILQKGYYNF